MIESRTYHGLDFSVAKGTPGKICYILLPEGLKPDGIRFLEDSSSRYSCSVVSVSGMDWNNDLTPWPAPGIFKREKPFRGKSEQFLRSLLDDYFPAIESVLGLHNPERFLAGVSLSGLFAVWSLFRTDTFRGIASISGSLWYDAFTTWARSHETKNREAKVFLSIGEKEKQSKNPRMAAVEDATEAIADILSNYGCTTELKIVPGTHFSPVIPRLKLALESILSSTVLP